jgi:nitrogen-specific signal transduction histidine kinase
MFAKPITIENAPAEMFSLVDITEFKCADEVQLKNELARISKSKSEAVELFAESVAHGFNELLTVITGHSQMGLMAIHEGDPIRKDFEEIDRAAELGSKLTWKLLTYAGRHSWDPVPLNLEDRIQAMEKVLKRILGNKIELEISSADTLRRVKLDPDLLEQVMLNLTLNAREAIPESGKVLIQLVSTDVGMDDASHPGIPAGSYVTLSYRDNGPGIPMEIRDRIFDPFFTTKSDRKGAGLGLATVYGVVRKSGGFIGVDSEPGKGTTFRLYFPAVAGEEEPIVEPDRVVAPTREETIMVVDDDDAVREMASQILRWHGFKVIEARSGREALQMCKKLDKPVDAVVSDVVMPNMGGIELMDNLRKLWGSVSVLYISGATADKTLDPNIPLLRKPFHPKELVKRVKEILGGQ